MTILLLTACTSEAAPPVTSPSTPTTVIPPTATSPLPAPTATLPPPIPTVTPRPTPTPTPAAAPEGGRTIIRLPKPTNRSRTPAPTPSPPGDAETILRRAITDPDLLQKALKQPFMESPDDADRGIALNLAAMHRRDPDQLRRLLEQRLIYDTGSPEQIAEAWLPPFAPRLNSITRTRNVAGQPVEIAAVAFGPPNPAIIENTAAAIETAAALTARPRINRVIIMTAEIGNGAQGVNYGTHIRIDPTVANPNHRRHRAVLAHEVMHYWFRGNDPLIDEGIAELASAVHIAPPGEPPQPRGWSGVYGRGEACMLALYRAAGPDAFAQAAGRLHDTAMTEDYADQYQGTALTMENLRREFNDYPDALRSCR